MSIYFSSDHHFFHNNIIKFCNRPFADVNEMNEILINNWNSVVGPQDTVMYLGDFSLSFRAVEVITPRLNGNKVLIPGNHDFCHTYHKRSRKSGEMRQKWVDKYRENGWIVSQQILTWPLSDGTYVALSHLPYKGDIPHDGSHAKKSGNFDKYYNYRPEDQGSWLICGHVHGAWRRKNKMINVGVDVWGYKPVHLAKIEEIVHGKDI